MNNKEDCGEFQAMTYEDLQKALAAERAALAAERAEKEKLAAERAADKERIAKLEKQVQEERQHNCYDIKGHVVLGASAAAKDTDARNRFRNLQVAETPCRGGFIAHKFYFDFVKAAREIGDSSMGDKQTEVINAVSQLGKILLSDRKPYSLLNHNYLDAESPQSAVGAELFKVAIESLDQCCNKTTSSPSLRVTHQQHLLNKIDQTNSKGIEIIRKRKQPPVNNESDADIEEKSEDKIDICVWFIHPDEPLGACVLAAIEYKPSNVNKVEREAQADMYGSNIWLLHKKPCVVVDIAGGGENLDDWTVSAHGLIKAEFSTGANLLEKTPLYLGKGAEAIVMICRGLLAARDSFVTKLEEYGSRLGPVVGIIDGYVYKVYDDAHFRNPNLKVVQALLDCNAELLVSKDEKLEILKMKKLESNWKEPVNVSIFAAICLKLKLLHDKFGPHGDIRLANLLSSGYIIDFDFVGAESYPIGLQKLDIDGERHQDVNNMINEAEHSIDVSLAPKKRHDWFSLAAVMRLFAPVDESNRAKWSDICQIVEDCGFQEATDFDDYQVQLTNLDIPLQGTGPSPIKKQPTEQSMERGTKRRSVNRDSIPEHPSTPP